MADPTHPPWRVEYIGPVIEFVVTHGTVWNIHVSAGNVGWAEEAYMVVFQARGSNGIRFSSPVQTVPAYEARAIGAAVDDHSDLKAVTGWWPRIYATSHDLIPSIHFEVETFDDPTPSTDPPMAAAMSMPFRNSFYVSPGDFAVRELRPSVIPPITPTPGGIESAERAPAIRWTLPTAGSAEE